jgi:hypothetical protein
MVCGEHARKLHVTLSKAEHHPWPAAQKNSIRRSGGLHFRRRRRREYLSRRRNLSLTTGGLIPASRAPSGAAQLNL